MATTMIRAMYEGRSRGQQPRYPRHQEVYQYLSCEIASWVRRKQEHFVGLSFPTIAGYGSNGAIIHYRPEPHSAARVGADKLFLVDSGAQYLCVRLRPGGGRGVCCDQACHFFPDNNGWSRVFLKVRGSDPRG
jgi:hypothetical protein